MRSLLILSMVFIASACSKGFDAATKESVSQSSTSAAAVTPTAPQSITNVGANITGASALSIAAGGTDQNLNLSGSGTGAVILKANVGIGTSKPTHALEVAGAINATTISVNGANVLTGITAAMVSSALGYTPQNGASLANSASQTSSVQSAANTIVQRDSNGYVFNNYFSMTANVNGNNPEYLVGEWGGDHFLRYVSPANVTVGTASIASRLASVGSGAMTFNWSGQGGQPAWLWGSNDGTNAFVWNPANFNVNHASSADQAGSLASGGDNVATSGWYRSNGKVGWYNNTYGGGINMVDTSWIRTVGNKGFYIQGGSLLVDGGGQFGQTVTAPTFTMTSDKRLKQDIKPLLDQLSNVIGLQPVSYAWNAKAHERGVTDQGKQIGFIAQEVEKLFPEAVVTAKDGYKSVNYSALISPVVGALKEFYAKYQSDSARVQADLKAKDAKIAELEKRLEKLEKFVSEKAGEERKPASK